MADPLVSRNLVSKRNNVAQFSETKLQKYNTEAVLTLPTGASSLTKLLLLKRLGRTLGMVGIREKLLRRIWSFLLARRCTDKGPGRITPLIFSTELSMAPRSQPHEA